MHRGCRRRRDCDSRIFVNIAHAGYLVGLVLWAILDNAKGIDPQIIYPKMVADQDGVPEGLRQNRSIRLTTLQLVEVSFCKGEHLRAAPAVSQSSILSRLTLFGRYVKLKG